METPRRPAKPSAPTGVTGGAATAPTVTGVTDQTAVTEETEAGEHRLIGRVLLGQFRIVKLIGAGGFGAAYLAEQKQLTGKSPAVVKFVRTDVSGPQQKQIRKRFLREVATLAKLDNHHLPKLLGSGEEDGQLFLVMQYGGDENLGSLLESQGRLPPARALEIALQVCEALREAHRWGVIHRDVKPDNILLTSKGGEDFVKLVDVGIAKLLDWSEVEDPNSVLSHARLVIGTPAYMSPEQAADSTAIDPRSDLYALTCVLYQMLSGKLPVRGNSKRELMVAHMTGATVPIRETGVPLPPFVSALIERGLQFEPERRFASAKEMQAALQDALARLGAQPARRRWPYFAAAAAAAAVAVMTIVIIRAPRPPPLAEPANVARAAPPAAEKPAEKEKEKEKPAVPEGMVWFPGGAFEAGRAAAEGEPPAPDAPAHRVSVSAFALQKTEVRVAEYAAFGQGAALQKQLRSPDLPIVEVARAEASRYCAFRFGRGGRLPTEHEWEWAARGGKRRAFPWGDSFRPECANAQGAGGKLESVESRPCGATPEGLLAMSGNAWEWTASDFAPYPGSSYAARAGLAVIRGGSYFQSEPRQLTTTWRWFAPAAPNPTIGFRCAWSPAAP